MAQHRYIKYQQIRSARVHIKVHILHDSHFSFSTDIEFKEGDTEHTVEVEILYDGVREMREAFTVHLKPDENMVAEIQVLGEHSAQFAHLIYSGGNKY